MKKNHIIVLGEKESFLIRVLIKKLTEAKYDAEFIPWKVTSIDNVWKETDLATIYMDDGCHPSDDVLHFLIDRMKEDEKQVILIGEKNDIQFICDHIPGDLIYKTYVRPVDNDDYVATVNELMHKVESGEFKKSILIVDDDPNYLGLVREWLKGTYRVAMANSGLQALKWLGKNKADLILLDHEMPVTSGPQVLEMLRSEDETRDIPVMFLTGKSDKQSVMQVMSLNPQGYFLKSIERQELMEKLEEFFALHV